EYVDSASLSLTTDEPSDLEARSGAVTRCAQRATAGAHSPEAGRSVSGGPSKSRSSDVRSQRSAKASEPTMGACSSGSSHPRQRQLWQRYSRVAVWSFLKRSYKLRAFDR